MRPSSSTTLVTAPTVASITLVNSLKDRILTRAGLWGVRGLRNALRAVALQEGGGDATIKTYRSVAIALEKYGIRGFARGQLEAAVPSLPLAVDAVMESLVDVGMPAARFASASRCFKAVLQALGCTDSIPLRTLCAAVQLQKHPDVSSSRLPLREALLTFFVMWGVDTLDYRVTEAAWMSFWADWSPSFRTSQAFHEFLTLVCDVDIPPPEAVVRVPTRAETDKVFNDIDFNRNGTLSLAELDLACLRLWPGLNDKRAIMRAYKLADASGNGLISRSEFRLFVAYLPIYASLAAKFRAADVDRDGMLSFEELKQNKALVGLGDLNDVELRQLFKAADANGGGRVSYEEFCVLTAKLQGDRLMSKDTNAFNKPPAIEVAPTHHAHARGASLQQQPLQQGAKRVSSAGPASR